MSKHLLNSDQKPYHETRFSGKCAQNGFVPVQTTKSKAQRKFVLVQNFQIFLNPNLYYWKPVQHFSFGPVQNAFVLECLQLFKKNSKNSSLIWNHITEYFSTRRILRLTGFFGLEKLGCLCWKWKTIRIGISSLWL
jgi:hypothetical protein